MNIKKLNGSFIINVNGLPFNTVKGDNYYNETLKLYESNPELFEIEFPPKEPRILRNLDEEKNILLREINQRCSSKILKKYSLTEQLNISNRLLGYTDSDFKEMKTYIEKEVFEIRRIAELINKCKSFSSLDKIREEQKC